MFKLTHEIPLDKLMNSLQTGWEARVTNIKTLAEAGFDEDEAIVRANRFAGMTVALGPPTPIPLPNPSQPLTIAALGE